MINRIDVLPGITDKTMICIAGWATGPRLFEYFMPQYRRVVVTPFDPQSVSGDLEWWCHNDGAMPSRVVGVSMGVPLAVQCARSWALGVPVLGIGANNGFDSRAMDDIAILIRRSCLGYLRQFWRACAAVPNDEPWTANSFLDVGWTVEMCLVGLEYLKRPWGELIQGVDPSSVTLIHGANDVISPMAPIRKFAEKHGVTMHVIDGVGHLPLGPFSMRRLPEIESI